MTLPWADRRTLVGIVVLAFAFLYLYWIAGDILRTPGDEGIYLEGGRRVARGQQPYRDFLALTGPLTFWIEGAIGRSTELSLAFMRLPLILDAAFLTWVVYWFSSRYIPWFYSATAALAYLAFESNIRKLIVNHRWDSAALAIASIALAFSALRTERRRYWIASGLLLAAAVCATPSMWIVAGPLLWWSWRRNIASLAALLSGCGFVAVLALIYLQSQHALFPMIEAFRWTAANYSGPNRVVYGYVPMLAASSSGAFAYLSTFAFAVLPAILPIAALLGWSWYLWHTADRKQARDILPLLASMAALVFSAWPRWSADTLLHTAALSWFLCALLLYQVTLPEQRRWLCGVILLVSFASIANKAAGASNYVLRESRVGTVRTAGDESEYLAALERWVQPGDSLFSYPYQPSLYYLLNAHNPTRYSFLQPGMMTPADELQAIGELEAAPPRWVIFENWPPSTVLTIWPGSDPNLIPMTAINLYLTEHYRPVENVTGPWGRMVVMERSPAPAR